MALITSRYKILRRFLLDTNGDGVGSRALRELNIGPDSSQLGQYKLLRHSLHVLNQRFEAPKTLKRKERGRNLRRKWFDIVIFSTGACLVFILSISAPSSYLDCILKSALHFKCDVLLLDILSAPEILYRWIRRPRT